MNTTRMRLSAVLLDTNIQCRASIDMDVVAQYAADMTEGAVFPPVVLFGTADCAYPGDGWHRIMAAQQVGYKEIPADLRPGGIKDALRHALGANRDHGLRRTNADKRRAVEIAIREFPEMSSRAIADICGVSDKTVEAARPNCGNSAVERKGADGKTRSMPTKRTPAESDDPDNIPGFREGDGEPETKEESKARKNTKPKPPCDGLQFARMAVMDLQQIQHNDTERAQAFKHVKDWINENE